MLRGLFKKILMMNHKTNNAGCKSNSFIFCNFKQMVLRKKKRFELGLRSSFPTSKINPEKNNFVNKNIYSNHFFVFNTVFPLINNWTIEN